MTEEDTSSFTDACDRAEKVALRLIARAEQSSLRLTAKLEKKGFDAPAAKHVVSSLVDRNLLNDARYAELWIRSRLSMNKKVTPLWLLSSLEKRGINRKASREALEKVLDPETEYSLLIDFMKKASARKSENPWAMKHYLKKEGFSHEILEKLYS